MAAAAATADLALMHATARSGTVAMRTTEVGAQPTALAAKLSEARGQAVARPSTRRLCLSVFYTENDSRCLVPTKGQQIFRIKCM